MRLTGEVASHAIKSLHHAHAGQDSVQVIRLLQLESRHSYFNISMRHFVWMSPLCEFLIGQMFLQLKG